MKPNPRAKNLVMVPVAILPSFSFDHLKLRPPPALAQKQELIARLQQEDIGPEEHDEIERLLEKIEAALDLLDNAGPSGRGP
jgi:hypothetical protein